MDRPDILVRVGAAFDRSFDAVLADAQRKWERAFGQGRGGTANAGAGAKQMLAVEQQIHAQRSKLNQQIYAQESKKELELAKLRLRLQSDTARERQRDARAQDSHVKAYYRNIVAEHQRAEAAKRAEERKTAAERTRANRAEQQAAYRRNREVDRLATRTSHRATRFFFPPPEGAIGYAKRIGFDMLRGAGVDTSLGGGFSRAVEVQRMAQLLSQNAYQPGAAGVAGKQASVDELTKDARHAAGLYGLKGGAENVLQGQSTFVSVTGDLETARALTEDIARLSAATGANFNEAMEASAAISNKLGDVPDKAQKIYALMRGFAWQGKLGAVEIRDMAKSMPRLLSGVTRFEGDLGQNMLKLGALAQMARGGPAGSAREAATGVARMADLFVTPARVKAMQKLGMRKEDIFTAGGAVRDPFEIIKRGLTRTGGDPLGMKKMFNNIMGSRPIERLTDIYRGGGKGKAGLAAVDAEIKRLMSGTDVGMSEDVVKNLAEQYSGTMEAKAARFQENLDKVTASMADKLVPAMEKLAPVALELVDKFGKVVNWAATNPGQAIVAAITASIARAGLESVGRMFLERLLVGTAGSVVGGAVGSGAGSAVGSTVGAGVGGAAAGGVSKLVGALGAAGGGVAGAGGVAGLLLAVAAAAGILTYSLLEDADEITRNSKRRQGISGNDIYQTFAEEYSSATTDEERKAAKDKARLQLEQDEGSRGPIDRLFGDQSVFLGTLKAIDSFAKENDDRRMAALEASAGVTAIRGDTKETLSEDLLTRSLANALTNKTLAVRVSNTDDFQFATPAGGSSGGGPPTYDWGPG